MLSSILSAHSHNASSSSTRRRLWRGLRVWRDEEGSNAASDAEEGEDEDDEVEEVEPDAQAEEAASSLSSSSSLPTPASVSHAPI
jgi:predicted Zn-dependent protease